jgi:hypothetical protein
MQKSLHAKQPHKRQEILLQRIGFCGAIDLLNSRI